MYRESKRALNRKEISAQTSMKSHEQTGNSAACRSQLQSRNILHVQTSAVTESTERQSLNKSAPGFIPANTAMSQSLTFGKEK